MAVMMISLFLLHSTFRSTMNKDMISSSNYLRSNYYKTSAEPPDVLAKWETLSVYEEFNKFNNSAILENNYQKITCSDNSIGYVNDDFCDCTSDGADERISSSCSHWLAGKKLFTCMDSDKQIFLSRISDGVKDCPMGDDEFLEPALHHKLAY